MPIGENQTRSPLAITMGDPCGIGPEIVARLFCDDANRHHIGRGCEVFVVGDVGVMRKAARVIGAEAAVHPIATPEAAAATPLGCIPVVQVTGLDQNLAELDWGQVDARAGAAAARCIEQAVAFIQAGRAAGIVTAPIHKEALHAAGFAYPGHTEMLQTLAARGGTLLPVRMMLANESLRTVLVTLHQSLRSAIESLSVESILETLRIAHRAGERFGLPHWRIAVAGLNPHAGEGGLFGDEEIRFIAPAIQAAVAEGICATGPYAPDTVFMRARHAPDHPGEFDVVVAMTHDHALIPVKYLGVEQGVNITLGLPFVRTSPDHGTAFDIAGKGLASPASLRAATAMAARLVQSSFS